TMKTESNFNIQQCSALKTPGRKEKAVKLVDTVKLIDTGSWTVQSSKIQGVLYDIKNPIDGSVQNFTYTCPDFKDYWPGQDRQESSPQLSDRDLFVKGSVIIDLTVDNTPLPQEHASMHILSHIQALVDSMHQLGLDLQQLEAVEGGTTTALNKVKR
ncbi:hypothetical protein BGZ46_002189, partial [Entomortierella lignicola]